MSCPAFPVILSGGAGSRLWPLSREAYPKQLIALVGEQTLLQTTVQRLASLENLRPPLIVCNQEHRFMAAEQIQAVGVTPTAILLEPVARNTAPAIAAAALEALARCDEGDEPLLLVAPADHIIQASEAFARAIRVGIREAAAGRLVTFGVPPTYAETGYGYIKTEDSAEANGEAKVAERFIEKPNADDAAALVKAGHCYWNSGIFAFRARRYLEELGRYAPAIREATEKAHQNATPDLGFLRLDAESFTRSPALSVDYAVMEHASDVVVVPLGVAWSDVGSWTTIAELSEPAERDAAGNVVQGDVLLQDTRNTYIRGENRLVATVGVENLIIVDTPDAVLIADKKAVQDTRKVVERLKQDDRDEYRYHRKVYRPWGHYDLVHAGDRFKIKHITIHPGQQLSLQMHRHRAEHWVVVHGTARVTRGEEVFTLSENESTFIPQGTRHRLENPGSEPLELVEVQSGDYLGEDDIVRFEDTYGRQSPEAPEK